MSAFGISPQQLYFLHRLMSIHRCLLLVQVGRIKYRCALCEYLIGLTLTCHAGLYPKKLTNDGPDQLTTHTTGVAYNTLLGKVFHFPVDAPNVTV